MRFDTAISHGMYGVISAEIISKAVISVRAPLYVAFSDT